MNTAINGTDTHTHTHSEQVSFRGLGSPCNSNNKPHDTSWRIETKKHTHIDRLMEFSIYDSYITPFFRNKNAKMIGFMQFPHCGTRSSAILSYLFSYPLENIFGILHLAVWMNVRGYWLENRILNKLSDADNLSFCDRSNVSFAKRVSVVSLSFLASSLYEICCSSSVFSFSAH